MVALGFNSHRENDMAPIFDTAPPGVAPDARRASPAIADRNLDAALLAARVLLVAIFPVAVYYKLAGWPGFVGTVAQTGMPLPNLLAPLAVAAEVVLPALVVLGLWTRPALLALAAFTLLAAFTGHPFWKFEGAAQFGQVMNFFKNVAMVGGMLAVAAVGPGRYVLRS